jgi:hypothetical protein
MRTRKPDWNWKDLSRLSVAWLNSRMEMSSGDTPNRAATCMYTYAGINTA